MSNGPSAGPPQAGPVSQGESPDLPGGRGAKTLPFVSFDKVWLAYNEELLAQNHFAVEDISLQLHEGEFIAIVGPSGCGKSTFMKLTTGLKMPSRGSIHIGGQPVTGH